METQPPPQPRRWDRTRIAIWIGVGMLIGAALLAMAAWIFIPPYLERELMRRARAHGVILEPTTVRWSGTEVVFERVNFSLVDVDGVRGRATEIVVAVSGLSPQSLVLREPYLRLDGSVSRLALALAVWSQRFPSSYRLPMTAQDVSVHWVANDGDPPWLVVESGSLHRAGGESGVFEAKRVKLAGTELGAVGARFDAGSAKIALGLGETQIDKAPVRVELNHAANPPTVDITVAPMPLATLGAPLGMRIPTEGVMTSGVVHLELTPDDPVHGPITGSASIALNGFIPPHPPELDGFIFGDVTNLQTKFAIDGKREHVLLQDVRVLAGNFRLTGTGSITREADHALIHFDLSGLLPCAALAGAAAESQLGQVVGKWVGKAAREMLQGNVRVILKVEADTRQLDQAKLIRRIGMGCGLKPIVIPGLGEIQMPKLPDLPTRLPELPPLPSFKVELPTLPPLKKPTAPVPAPAPVAPAPAPVAPAPAAE